MFAFQSRLFLAISLLLAGVSLPAIHADAQAPYGLKITVTREQPACVLYDKVHARFYASVPGENAVYVIAESTGAVTARVPVNDPGQLALSPDDSHLYVAASISFLGQSAAVGFADISTAALRVVDFVQTQVNQATINQLSYGYSPDTVPTSLAALSSGKVLMVGQAIGVTGGQILLSDPGTRLATQIPDEHFYDGVVAGSSDGTTVILAAVNSVSVQLELRASDGSLSSSLNFNTLNSSDVAITADGQTVSVGGRYLFTNKFAQMATLPSVSSGRSAGSVFSPDGSRLYVLTSPGSASTPVVAVFSPATLQLLGYLPLPAAPSGAVPQAIAAGSSGRILVVTSSALVEMDTSSLMQTVPGNVNGFAASPNAGLASSPSTVSLNFSNSHTPAVFFGQSPASITATSSYSTSVQPSPAASGVVPISVLLSDGSLGGLLNGYSFGPTIQHVSVTAGATGGGTLVKLYGLGLGTSTSFPTVTVGGAAATVTAVSSANGEDVVTFKTPAGSAGAADLTLTSYAGTITQPGAFLYCPYHLVPSLVPYQMVNDNVRNQLYVADYATSSVLAVDGSTFAVRTLFRPAYGAPTSLALTPDGSTLLVLNQEADTLDLIDLASGSDRKTLIPNPGSVAGAYSPNNLAATARGTALVSLNNNGVLAGTLVEVNLTTGAVAPVNVGLRFGPVIPSTLIAANLAGDRIALAADGSLGFSGTATDQWQAGTDATVVETSQVSSVEQIATDDLGDITLQDDGVLDAQLIQFSNLAPDSTLAAARSLVYGEALHSSGALAYVPTTQGVEVADIHHGNTVLSLGVPDGSLEGDDNLAVTHSGSRVYFAQPNGIGVFDLPVVPLSIGSLTPSAGPAAGGTSVLLRGSGFTPSTAVMVDGHLTATTYIDATQVSFTTPAISPAKVNLTVQNGSVAYSLDAAFDASPASNPAPSLTSISPSYVRTGSSGANVLVTGSNFTPSTQFQLNGIRVASSFQNTTGALVAYNAIPGPGAQAVTALNPPNSTFSNPVFINTYNSAPYINSTLPGSIPAGSATFTLRIYANSILPSNSVALWNGTPLASTVYGSNYLYAAVPASLIASPTTASLTVIASGYGTSNAISFTVTPAIAALVLTPSSLTFSPVLAGNSSSATATLTSTGAVPAVISSITLSNPTFSQTNTCPSSLAQGQSCAINVVFTPTSSGTGYLDTLTISSNAAPVISNQFAAAGDIALSGTSPSPVAAGQSATAGISIITYGVLPASTLQIACSSGLPVGAACKFSPSSVALPAVTTGNYSTNVVVTITTSAGTRVMLEPSSPKQTFVYAGLLLTAGLLTRRRRLRHALLILFTLFLSTLVIACGNGATSSGNTGGGGGTLVGNTPAGSYTVTVTTTSGKNVHAGTVNLVVQ